jgi:aspartate/methionine/tyrosine aminotransferase
MIRPAIDSLPASRIREVANAGIGRDDVLKFWFGEGDRPTPEFIRSAAKAALDAGETFYQHNLGSSCASARRIPEPAACAARRPLADRIAVTSAGVIALALIGRVLFEPGDRVDRPRSGPT